jgi:hypothetical protein
MNEKTDGGKPPVQSNSINRVKWSDLYKSSKHLGVVTAPMLRGDVMVQKECKLFGEKNSDPKKLRDVVYDREFVVNQVATNCRFILTDCTYDEWLQLCREMWYVHNDPEDITLIKEMTDESE